MSNETGTDGTMSAARLERFEEEVGKLKVTGGAANPERLGSAWGVGLTVFGLVVALISWWSAYNAGDFESIHRSAIFALIGVGVAVVGMIVWIRNSMTRYLRYWIIRIVYEQREQTDRLIEALRER